MSAVRAPESRLARLRCELRSRVPHEDAVSVTSKLAQWVEQRSSKPCVVGSTPMLAPACEAGFRESAGLGSASRCPGGDADHLPWPAKVGRLRGSDRSTRFALSGQGAQRWKRAAMRLNLAWTRAWGRC